ncbi:hypothetical protein OTU49_009396 [Cherax quadricarinatus]|uniref:Uncharacterized protein n=1 Tax=Cherax quadricarinatus TaxID=27406 RepID=A0AAW0WLW5_CHEQU
MPQGHEPHSPVEDGILLASRIPACSLLPASADVFLAVGRRLGRCHGLGAGSTTRLTLPPAVLLARTHSTSSPSDGRRKEALEPLSCVSSFPDSAPRISGS